MPEDVPAAAMEALRQLGQVTQGPERDALLAAVNRWKFVNRQHWKDWDRMLEPLTAIEHEAVAKGVVMAEEAHRWCGGSVAAAIWIYRAFARKFPDAAESLAGLDAHAQYKSMGAIWQDARLRPALWMSTVLCDWRHKWKKYAKVQSTAPPNR